MNPSLIGARQKRLAALFLVVGMLATACGNRRPLDEAGQLAFEGMAVPGGAGGGAGGVVAGGSQAGSSSTGSSGSSTAGAGGSPVGGGTSTGGSSTGGSSQAGGSSGGGAAIPGPASRADTSTADGDGGAAGGSGGGAADPGAGDTGDTGANEPSGPATYDSGASDERIVFGSVSSLTGLFADFMQPRGARAWFRHVNAAEGGIGGRQLELLIYDDQWDTTRNAALHRQAFESDGVFAFVFNGAPLSSHGGRSYVEQNNIPVIGGDLIDSQSWGKSPMFFPQSYLESDAGGYLAGRYAVLKLGCTKVAGFSLAVDESRGWVKAFERALKEEGHDGYIYSADISFAETDYNSYVATAKSRGADCLTFGGQTANFNRLRQAQDQQSYHPTWMMPSSLYDPAYTDAYSDVTEGVYAMVQYDILEHAADNPALQQFVQAANQFEPDMKQSGYALLAYSAAQMATDALKKMGNTFTRQALLDALHTFDGWTNDIVPPATFKPGPKVGAQCGNVIAQNGAEFKMVARDYCV